MWQTNRIIAISFLLLGLNVRAAAQCCSIGNPLSCTAQSGVQTEKSLKVYVYYKSGNNQTYFRKNIKMVNYGVYKSSAYDFSGIQLSYGITQRFTIDHNIGYFFRKEFRYNDKLQDDLAPTGKGLSNGIVGFRYLVSKGEVSGIQLSGGASLKYPFSTEMKSVNGVVLPVELQPSTRAFGYILQAAAAKYFVVSGMSAVVQHMYEHNFPDPKNYSYGSVHTTTLAVSKQFLGKFTAVAALRNEYKSSDETPGSISIASQGSNLLFFAPRVDYMINQHFSVSAFGDVPVYKYYFGEQLSVHYAFGIGLSTNLNFSR